MSTTPDGPDATYYMLHCESLERQLATARERSAHLTKEVTELSDRFQAVNLKHSEEKMELRKIMQAEHHNTSLKQIVLNLVTERDQLKMDLDAEKAAADQRLAELRQMEQTNGELRGKRNEHLNAERDLKAMGAAMRHASKCWEKKDLEGLRLILTDIHAESLTNELVGRIRKEAQEPLMKELAERTEQRDRLYKRCLKMAETNLPPKELMRRLNELQVRLRKCRADRKQLREDLAAANKMVWIKNRAVDQETKVRDALQKEVEAHKVTKNALHNQKVLMGQKERDRKKSWERIKQENAQWVESEKLRVKTVTLLDQYAAQIDALAKELLENHTYPQMGEGACQVAIRYLKEYKKALEDKDQTISAMQTNMDDLYALHGEMTRMLKGLGADFCRIEELVRPFTKPQPFKRGGYIQAQAKKKSPNPNEYFID